MSIKFNEVTWYSKLGAVIVLLIALPALCFYIGIQYGRTFPDAGQLALQQASTSAPTHSQTPSSPQTPAPADDSASPAKPVIESITPSRGPKGTVVEIHGENLAGFEGDLDVYFERADGKRVMLTDLENYGRNQGTYLNIKVTEPCKAGEKIIGRYSGLESLCDFVELKPGVYKVYGEPWGVKSNVVTFTITK